MTEKNNQTAFEQAKAVKQAHEQELLAKPNVVGVGVGLRQQKGKFTDDVAIVVMVSQKKPSPQLNQEDVIPAEIDGVPVDVQEVGEFQAH